MGCAPSIWSSEKLIMSLKNCVCCSKTCACNALTTWKPHLKSMGVTGFQERSSPLLSLLSYMTFHNPVLGNSLCLLFIMTLILTSKRFLPRCFFFAELFLSYKSSNEFKTQHKNKDHCHYVFFHFFPEISISFSKHMEFRTLCHFKMYE